MAPKADAAAEGERKKGWWARLLGETTPDEPPEVIIQALVQELAAAKSQAEQLAAERETVRRALEDRAQELGAAVAKSEAARVAAEQKSAQSRKEIAKLTQSLAGAATALDSLRAQVAALTEDKAQIVVAIDSARTRHVDELATRDAALERARAQRVEDVQNAERLEKSARLAETRAATSHRLSEERSAELIKLRAALQRVETDVGKARSESTARANEVTDLLARLHRADVAAVQAREEATNAAVARDAAQARASALEQSADDAAEDAALRLRAAAEASEGTRAELRRCAGLALDVDTFYLDAVAQVVGHASALALRVAFKRTRGGVGGRATGGGDAADTGEGTAEGWLQAARERWRKAL